MKHLPKSHATLIDKQVFRFSRSGQGSPSIVLLAGAGGPLDSWHKLYPDIEQLGTVFAYDRPGVGGSAKPREPQPRTPSSPLSDVSPTPRPFASA